MTPNKTADTNAQNENKKHNKSKIPGLEVRIVAQRLLGAVIDKKTSLDGLTDYNNGHPLYLALTMRDRALTRAILASALRHRELIQQALTELLDRPLPENAHSLKQLLHVGAAQILYLDVPDHAAINLAVTAAKNDPRNSRFAGLVNAILRQVSRSKDDICARDEIITPSWFSSLLEKQYGKEKAQAIIRAQAFEAPLDLTVKGNVQDWAQKLNGIALPIETVRLDEFEGALTELDGFVEGDWWVQDIAASLPAYLMGDIKDKNVADLCAAPGGKTAQLAKAGAKVTALDISKNRLNRLQENMTRLQFEVTTVNSDLKNYNPEQLFDAVLLDAPCSSTGTIRRHPDILYTKSLDDVIKLAEVQRDLLDHAVRLTKPGGTIVFSNCSLAHQEGENLVKDYLKTRQDICLSPIKASELSGLEFLIQEDGTLRSTPADLPNENPRLSGMDGFFAARFIKNA